jgi:hypothetical protein
MKTSATFNNQRTTLACAICARLTLRWRVAAEHESGEAARVERSAMYASLQEYRALAAISTDARRETEEALNALRTHRATHNC